MKIREVPPEYWALALLVFGVIIPLMVIVVIAALHGDYSPLVGGGIGVLVVLLTHKILD